MLFISVSSKFALLPSWVFILSYLEFFQLMFPFMFLHFIICDLQLSPKSYLKKYMLPNLIQKNVNVYRWWWRVYFYRSLNWWWCDGGVWRSSYLHSYYFGSFPPGRADVLACFIVDPPAAKQSENTILFFKLHYMFFSATLPPFSLFASTAEPRTRTLLWTRGFTNGTKCPQLTSWVLKFAFDNLIFNCRGPLRVCVVDMLRECWGWGTASVMFDAAFYLFHWTQERERILALFSSYAPCCHSPMATFWRLFDGRGSRETAKLGASVKISKLATMKGPVCGPLLTLWIRKTLWENSIALNPTSADQQSEICAFGHLEEANDSERHAFFAPKPRKPRRAVSGW